LSHEINGRYKATIESQTKDTINWNINTETEVPDAFDEPWNEQYSWLYLNQEIKEKGNREVVIEGSSEEKEYLALLAEEKRLKEEADRKAQEKRLAIRNKFKKDLVGKWHGNISSSKTSYIGQYSHTGQIYNIKVNEMPDCTKTKDTGFSFEIKNSDFPQTVKATLHVNNTTLSKTFDVSLKLDSRRNEIIITPPSETYIFCTHYTRNNNWLYRYGFTDDEQIILRGKLVNGSLSVSRSNSADYRMYEYKATLTKN